MASVWRRASPLSPAFISSPAGGINSMFYVECWGIKCGWKPWPLFFQRLILFPDVISVAMEFHSAPLESCSCSYLQIHFNDLMKCIQTFIKMISALLIVQSAWLDINTGEDSISVIWELQLDLALQIRPNAGPKSFDLKSPNKRQSPLGLKTWWVMENGSCTSVSVRTC